MSPLTSKDIEPAKPEPETPKAELVEVEPAEPAKPEPEKKPRAAGRPKNTDDGMYQCVEAFVTPDGISVAPGDLVRNGHPIMRNRGWAFKPFAGPRFDVEQATSAPGEKR